MKARAFLRTTIATAWACLGAAAALAQTLPPQAPSPPTAGEILQQVQRAPAINERTLTTSNGLVVNVPDAPAMAEAQANAVIDVKGYRSIGNTAFPEATLLNVIGNRTGALSLVSLDRAAQAVTTFYRNHGYLVARAYVPEQEVTNGIVTIAVLEGRYDQIDVSNQSRLSSDRVERTIERPICGKPACDGSLVNERSLERGLLLLGDTPGVVAVGEVAPGSVVGTSRLEVRAQGAGLFHGVAEVNNSGNYYTGRIGLAATLEADSPFHFGDQMLLQFTGAGHQVFGGVQYSVPLNQDGTRLSVRFSDLSYALADVYQPLDAHGTARTFETKVSHPFIRSSRTNVMVTGTLANNDLRDVVGTTGSANPRSLFAGTAQVDLNHTDKALRYTGLTTASLAFTEGRLHLSDPVNALFDQLTAQTSGAFNKWSYSASRLQPVAKRVAVFASLQGQYTAHNLDSFEKFFLGGPTAVRAYPVGEASGDRGILLTAEMRWQAATLFRGPLEVTPLFDYGVVSYNAQPYTDDPNSRHLLGPGVRLGWTQARGVRVNGTIAFRGSDQFRSIPDKHYSAWLSASYGFK